MIAAKVSCDGEYFHVVTSCGRILSLSSSISVADEFELLDEVDEGYGRPKYPGDIPTSYSVFDRRVLRKNAAFTNEFRGIADSLIRARTQ